MTPTRAQTAWLTAPRDRRFLVLSGVAAVALGVVAALVDYARVARVGLPLGWDESLHAVAGLMLADDLRRHDILAFIRDSNAQVFYPPASAWFQAPTLFWTPVDDGVARIASLIALVLLAGATWALGAVIASRLRWAAGGVASALLVASPMTLAMATQPMIEVFNGLTIVSALVAQVMYRNTGKRWWTTAAALLLLLNCLTKYNYAAFLLLAFVLDHAIEGDFARARLTTTFRGFYQPLALGLAVWLAPDFGGKVSTAIGFGISLAIDAHRTWSQELTYYAGMLLDGGVRGPLGVTLVVGGLVGAALTLRRPNLRLVWLVCLISYVLLTIHPNKQARFLEPVVPVFLALAAAGLTSGVTSIIGLSDRRPLGAAKRAGSKVGPSSHLSSRFELLPLVAVVVFTMVYAVTQISSLQSPTRADVMKRDSIHGVVSFIAQSIPPGHPAIVVGTFADMGPYYVNWSLRGAWHSDASAVVTDYSALAYPGPLPRGNIDPSPSPRYAMIWSTWRGEHPDYWLVTIHLDRSSPFWTSEFGSANAWRQNYVAAIAESGERTARTFDDGGSGLVVKAYPPTQSK